MQCPQYAGLVAAGLLVALPSMPAWCTERADTSTISSTMSVGITIVAAESGDKTAMPAARTHLRRRIPVDPAYAIGEGDPLRNAKVERISVADGKTIQVVTY